MEGIVARELQLQVRQQNISCRASFVYLFLLKRQWQVFQQKHFAPLLSEMKSRQVTFKVTTPQTHGITSLHSCSYVLLQDPVPRALATSFVNWKFNLKCSTQKKIKNEGLKSKLMRNSFRQFVSVSSSKNGKLKQRAGKMETFQPGLKSVNVVYFNYNFHAWSILLPTTDIPARTSFPQQKKKNLFTLLFCNIIIFF